MAISSPKVPQTAKISFIFSREKGQQKSRKPLSLRQKMKKSMRLDLNQRPLRPEYSFFLFLSFRGSSYIAIFPCKYGLFRDFAFYGISQLFLN